MPTVRCIVSVLVGLSVYLPATYWLEGSYQPKPGPSRAGLVVKLRRPFSPFGVGRSLAFVAVEPSLDGMADDTERSKSPVLLYEDDEALGPAHSEHLDIVRLGGGRFSHWITFHGFVFSTTDGTNPNRNGRDYWAVIPRAR
jgi:hypothetical protein